MNEKGIKELVFKWVLENKSPNTVVVNEFATIYWKRRADLLIVNDCIHLIEIKSSGDNLSRLKPQIEYFLSKGHEVTLIADIKHRNRIHSLPKEVGILWFTNGKLALGRHSTRKGLSSKTLAEYWRLSELKMLFKGIVSKVYEKHVGELQSLLASYPVEAVNRVTCGLLKARYRKYSCEAKTAGTIAVPRVSKRGIEDPQRDYPSFFKEARGLLPLKVVNRL